MPRLKPRDSEEALGAIVWNDVAKAIPAAEYSRRTGISPETVRNHKKKPRTMSALDLIAYANASGMTDARWMALRKIR